MKFNFRQGIQHSPATSGHPSFLTYNPGADRVSISVGVDLVRASAAWGEHNYLIEERVDATEAWALEWNPSWGLEPVGHYTIYLYWDINRSTGLVSRGFTPYNFVFNEIAPLEPNIDQHWFDTNTNTMNVWDGTIWRKVIRVFAGSFTKGTLTITEQPFGTQVGINTNSVLQNDWYDHGYIVFGADQRAIRFNDTSFVNTATPINTNHGSFTSPLRLELLNSTVIAREPLPAFYVVSNDGDGGIYLASDTVVERRPIGLTMADANPGDPVDIVTHGIVYNDQWTWDVSGGEKDLYCGPTGELLQGLSDLASRVGTILSPQTILVDIDLYSVVGGTGIAGPVGPTGPATQGPTGPAGASGISVTGPTGPAGASGISVTGPTGPAGAGGNAVNHQLFRLRSVSASLADTQINSLWTIDTLDLNNDWPVYVTTQESLGQTEFVFVEAGTYEIRIMWTGYTNGFGENDFTMGLTLNTELDAAFVLGDNSSQNKSYHPLSGFMQEADMTNFGKASWVDNYVVTADINGVLKIGAYAESYFGAVTPITYILNVVIEKIGPKGIIMQ